MLLLALGLVVFLGVHLVTRARGLRTRLVGRLGEGRYKGLYSLASALGLVLTIYAYAHAPAIALWSPPVWTRHLAILLMWPAFILMASAYLPGHIRAKAKHPMLAGVKLWATAHLIANGDLASALLFGSFLAWAVVARILLARQERAEGSPRRTASWRNDAIAVMLGTVVYGLFGVFLHPILIGVPAFPL